MNFQELLNNYNIKIPIIQRDYAQGRNTNTDVCKNFLNALHDSITNKQPINLDFVYGNIYEQSFEQIWNGEKRVKIKRFLECDLNAKKCPPNCRPNAINEFLNEIMQANVKHINFI